MALPLPPTLPHWVFLEISLQTSPREQFNRVRIVRARLVALNFLPQSESTSQGRAALFSKVGGVEGQPPLVSSLIPSKHFDVPPHWVPPACSTQLGQWGPLGCWSVCFKSVEVCGPSPSPRRKWTHPAVAVSPGIAFRQVLPVVH